MFNKTIILNTILLSDNATHEQRLTAIELLKRIDKQTARQTTSVSCVKQSALYNNVDSVVRYIKEL